jgi:hypothetical protein
MVLNFLNIFVNAAARQMTYRIPGGTVSLMFTVVGNVYPMLN